MLTNTQAILTEFETIIGDATELSSAEELELLNKIYFEVLRQKDWEFLKKESTGSVNGTDITQPADFSHLLTDPDPVIYLGENNNPFRVIPFSERRIYKNQNNFAYYDARQGKFVFLRSQNDDYSFDYIYVPPALDTTSSNPVFPQRFWNMLPFFMASDNDFINLVEKARSYAGENRQRGEMLLRDMEMWNDKLSNYLTYGN